MLNSLKTRVDFRKTACVRLPRIAIVRTKPVRRWAVATLTAMALASGIAGTEVYAKTYPKEEVRAAFLFNFLKFVEWPTSAFDDDESPYRICMFGDIGSKQIFDQLGVQKAKSRTIQINYDGADNKSNLDDYEFGACHIVYLGFMQTDRAVVVLESVADKPVLTVSIIDDFIVNGGMIALVSQDKKNKLQINLKAAQTAQLKISANMLDVAEIIEP